MEKLVFINNLQSKSSSFILITILVLSSLSCKKDDNLKALYNSAANHAVFKVNATINPLKEIIAIEDTIWITINASSLKLKDAVSGKDFTINNAQFITQLEMYDMYENSKVVDMEYILKSGETYYDQSNFTESGKNSYGFKFGYPEPTILKIGFLFKEPGYYAIWFNNFPNPYHGCSGNSCDIGKGFWYDIFWNWNDTKKAFDNEDFTDYCFTINSDTYDQTKFTDIATPFLEYCVYKESIVFMKVR